MVRRAELPAGRAAAHPARNAHSPNSAATLAVLLPLLGLGRRFAYSQLLQLLVVSQYACAALLVCPAGGTPRSYDLLPPAYYAVG
jgi:hypothetical protein